MAIHVAQTARLRSHEAELASEAVAAEPDHLTNAHAAQLHDEAAVWHRKADQTRRAARHDAYARVHAQLAARLRPEED